MVRFSDLKKTQPSGGASTLAASNGGGRTPTKPGRISQLSPEGLPGAGSDAGPGNVYEDASFYLTKVFAAVKGRRRFGLEPGFQIVRRISESAAFQDALFVEAIQRDDTAKYLINKSINVAIYAVRLADQLGYARPAQMEIGLAGLLHEVGMCAISDRIVHKREQLSGSEFGQIRRHSEAGYKILKDHSDRHPYLAEVALQVHERIDGSGYPQGLKGDEIHEYAQIIGLVDVYEALTHSRPQRDRFSPFAAVKDLIRTGKSLFAKDHLKALLTAFSIFPISTWVRLNSNAVGRVIATYPDQPMRPKLQIEYDSQGRKVLTERVVNLPDNSLLFIVDSVEPGDIEQLARGVSSHRPNQSFKEGISPG